MSNVEQNSNFTKPMLGADMGKLSKSDYENFYRNPDKHIPIDKLGDLYLNWFYERYAALRMLKNLPIFEKAYKILTDRKNYTRKNAFGEMHGDGYLWIVPHPKIKVIVEERQSFRYIYISDGYKFHIRALDYECNYPALKKNELKGITIQKFRKQGFVPYCSMDVNAKRFDAFTYGDRRDDGYVLSMEYCLKGFEKVDNPDGWSLSAIKNLEYWEIYLDDPSELE